MMYLLSRTPSCIDEGSGLCICVTLLTVRRANCTNAVIWCSTDELASSGLPLTPAILHCPLFSLLPSPFPLCIFPPSLPSLYPFFSPLFLPCPYQTVCGHSRQHPYSRGGAANYCPVVDVGAATHTKCCPKSDTFTSVSGQMALACSHSNCFGLNLPILFKLH